MQMFAEFHCDFPPIHYQRSKNNKDFVLRFNKGKPLRGGGGGLDPATKEKGTFFLI